MRQLGLSLLAFLLFALDASAATVTGNLKFVTGSAAPSQKIEFSPMDAPFATGVNTVLPRSARVTAGTSGDFTISILQGSYRVSVENVPVGFIRVPTGSETYNINSLWACFVYLPECMPFPSELSAGFLHSDGTSTSWLPGLITNIIVTSQSPAIIVTGSPIVGEGGTLTLDFDESQLDLSNVTGLVPVASLPTNSVSSAGIVAAGSGFGNKVWSTDSDGNPSWRDAPNTFGSGTPSTLARWTGTNTLGDSLITQPSTNQIRVAGELEVLGDATKTNLLGGAGTVITNKVRISGFDDGTGSNYAHGVIYQGGTNSTTGGVYLASESAGTAGTGRPFHFLTESTEFYRLENFGGGVRFKNPSSSGAQYTFDVGNNGAISTSSSGTYSPSVSIGSVGRVNVQLNDFGQGLNPMTSYGFLANSTGEATSSTRNNTPAYGWQTKGWSTNAAQSQRVAMGAYLVPFSGGDFPSGLLKIDSALSNASPTTVFSLSTSSGYAGGGTKYLSDDGTYKTVSGASADDTAFASSWNGVTTTPPSKNAVYDWAHTFDTDDDGKANVLDMGAGLVKTDSGGVVSAAASGDVTTALGYTPVNKASDTGVGPITMTGALTLPAGTNSAPSLVINSSGNGLYANGANTVAIATSGTLRWYVDSSGALRGNGTGLYPGADTLVPGGFNIGWQSGYPKFYAGAYGDGVIAMVRSDSTTFSSLIWGPGDASHVRMKRSGTALQARLGDDSGDATLQSMGAPLYEGKLATVTGIDVNTGTKSTIYTVPAGKNLVVTKVIVRAASTSLTTASFGFGFNANADDVVASATHTELTGSTLYTKIEPKVGAVLGAAADVFGLKCTVNQGAAATVSVDLFGFFY